MMKKIYRSLNKKSVMTFLVILRKTFLFYVNLEIAKISLMGFVKLSNAEYFEAFEKTFTLNFNHLMHLFLPLILLLLFTVGLLSFVTNVDKKDTFYDVLNLLAKIPSIFIVLIGVFLFMTVLENDTLIMEFNIPPTLVSKVIVYFVYSKIHDYIISRNSTSMVAERLYQEGYGSAVKVQKEQ